MSRLTCFHATSLVFWSYVHLSFYYWKSCMQIAPKNAVFSQHWLLSSREQLLDNRKSLEFISNEKSIFINLKKNVLNHRNNILEACVRDDFCFNNTGLMRCRKSLCDLAGRRDCRRPELWKQTCCFSLLKEQRAGLVGIWVWCPVLMPDISIKNYRKFSGERPRLSG